MQSYCVIVRFDEDTDSLFSNMSETNLLNNKPYHFILNDKVFSIFNRLC